MKVETIEKINQLSKENSAFVAIISYDCPDNDIICPIEKTQEQGIFFKYYDKYIKRTDIPKYACILTPVDFEIYKKAFDKVQNYIQKGDIDLINLCFKTGIETNLSLEQIYEYSNAPLVVMLRNKFVCFTPEIFVNIEGNRISTFPMKGTISANIPNAKEILLNDQKEHKEQVIICELMKNELARVSTNINVDRFRYFTHVENKNGNIWQTSSEISGILKPEYEGKLGSILENLLPAGSISGMPKENSTKIAAEVESSKREYYTGVFIHFDGKICKSYVLIRFVGLDQNKNLYYFSGGGITKESEVKKEYEELKQKVYFTF